MSCKPTRKTDLAGAAPRAVAAGDAGPVLTRRARAPVDGLLAVIADEATGAAAGVNIVGDVGAVAAVLARAGGAAVAATASVGGARRIMAECGAAAACAH